MPKSAVTDFGHTYIHTWPYIAIQLHVALFCRFNGLHPVIFVNTWFTTYTCSLFLYALLLLKSNEMKRNYGIWLRRVRTTTSSWRAWSWRRWTRTSRVRSAWQPSRASLTTGCCEFISTTSRWRHRRRSTTRSTRTVYFRLDGVKATSISSRRPWCGLYDPRMTDTPVAKWQLYSQSKSLCSVCEDNVFYVCLVKIK